MRPHSFEGWCTENRAQLFESNACHPIPWLQSLFAQVGTSQNPVQRTSLAPVNSAVDALLSALDQQTRQ